MLSIKRTTDRVWDVQFQRMLSHNSVLDEKEIRQVFRDAIRWADERGIEHKRGAEHYASQYLRTAAKGDPVIPKFMRWYIADRLRLRIKEEETPMAMTPMPELRIQAHAS